MRIDNFHIAKSGHLGSVIVFLKVIKITTRPHTYHVLICLLSQHASKGHIRGQCSKENVDKRSQTLNMQGVGEVGDVEGDLSLDVIYQAAERTDE